MVIIYDLEYKTKPPRIPILGW